MGFFHCRPITPSEDFILTAPKDVSELGEYRVYSKKHGWYFCKSCGVRILGLGGEWEQVDLDVEEWAGTKKEGEKQSLKKVWKTKGEPVTTVVDGKEVTKPYYLSVNAVTLEPGAEIDLTKWHENGWIFYVENLKKEENGSQMRLNKAYDGGMY
jgi:hypothetical protein